MAYHHDFNDRKPDKKLKWLWQLGTVELDIQLKDRKLSLEVSPLQAAVAELFARKPA